MHYSRSFLSLPSLSLSLSSSLFTLPRIIAYKPYPILSYTRD